MQNLKSLQTKFQKLSRNSFLRYVTPLHLQQNKERQSEISPISSLPLLSAASVTTAAGNNTPICKNTNCKIIFKKKKQKNKKIKKKVTQCRKRQLWFYPTFLWQHLLLCNSVALHHCNKYKNKRLQVVFFLFFSFHFFVFLKQKRKTKETKKNVKICLYFIKTKTRRFESISIHFIIHKLFNVDSLWCFKPGYDYICS